MNYLAHLFLSDDEEDVLLGNLMGDFVKGRLDDRYPKGIVRGLQQHRRADQFARTNAQFQASRRCIDPALGHLRSVLVDIYYDHFLARDWGILHPTPLPRFAARIYALLERRRKELPAGLAAIAPSIVTHDWFNGYGRLETVDLVLKRMVRRFSRPVDLPRGSVELRRHYAVLRRHFHAFILEAKQSPYIANGHNPHLA